MNHTIAILALENCLATSLHASLDLFDTANLIARTLGEANNTFKVRVLSEHGTSVTASNGLTVSVNGSIKDLENSKYLIIPGIGLHDTEDIPGKLLVNEVLKKSIIKASNRGCIITATCTSTIFLANTGLLNGKRATTTWWLEDSYKNLFPKVDLDIKKIIVRDENIITTAAGASSLDLALYIIQELEGPELSRKCAKYLLIDSPRLLQTPYIIPWHAKKQNSLIEKADTWIRSRSAVNCCVDDLALHLNLSSRTLLRRFKEHSNITPQEYIQNVKTDLIKLRLELTEDYISNICEEFGFSDENSFRRSFVKVTGLTPVAYRKKFRYELES